MPSLLSGPQQHYKASERNMNRCVPVHIRIFGVERSTLSTLWRPSAMFLWATASAAINTHVRLLLLTQAVAANVHPN